MENLYYSVIKVDLPWIKDHWHRLELINRLQSKVYHQSQFQGQWYIDTDRKTFAHKMQWHDKHQIIPPNITILSIVFPKGKAYDLEQFIKKYALARNQLPSQYMMIEWQEGLQSRFRPLIKGSKIKILIDRSLKKLEEMAYPKSEIEGLRQALVTDNPSEFHARFLLDQVVRIQ